MSIRKERARIFASTKILALSLRIAHRPKEEEVVEAEQPVLALQVGSETKEITLRSLTWLKGVMSEYQEEIASFANFPSLFMGLVNDVNELEHYDVPEITRGTRASPAANAVIRIGASRSR